MQATSIDTALGGWKSPAAAPDPDTGSYCRLLRQCGNEKSLLQGRQIHARLAAMGCADRPELGRAIVEMYLKCGSVIEARSVFRQLCSSSDDASLWTAIVAAFSYQGHFHDAFQFFESMLQWGVPIDKIALLTVLNVCTKAGALEQGRRVRGYCDESGLSADIAVATAIVNLYGKCRELNEAIAVFEETEVTRNIVTWTVMVAAYAQAGHCKEAFGCVTKMLLEGILPNEFTFVNALGSCGGGGGDLARGRMLHVWILERGMESNPVLANALVGMYSRCGGVDEAAKVFDSVRSGARDVVMWTSLIAAYGLCGFFEAAFRVFQMMLLEGVRPDRVSFITVLTSVMPAQAQAVRNLVCECGFDTDVVVGTALVEMLSRGGKLSSAREAFDRITHPAVASWSALMSAMVEHGYHAEAVITFRSRLLLEGLEIDKIALLTILGACSSPIFLPIGT